jgi:hypothetical protein
MSELLAGLLVLAAAGYFAAGVRFAIGFAGWLAGRLDPAAGRGSWGFRLLIPPGAKVLGPPAIDREFKTIDWLVLLDVAELSAPTFRCFSR